MIPELKVFLVAMSPVVELRGAIPLALKVYHLPVFTAYLLSVLGNLVPLLSIVLVGRLLADFLSSKCVCLEKFFVWLFAKVGKKANLLLGKTGRDLTVLILTAIPIPFIGGWTGALSAIVLEVPRKKAVFLVAAGAMISGLIVLSLSLGFK
jgi:uncharacterized membrane protein